MNQETLDQIKRIQDGMNGNNQDTAIAADTLKALGLDHPETIDEQEVTKSYEDMLNEHYVGVTIGWESFDPATIQRELSPRNYRLGLNDYKSEDYTESPAEPDRYYSKTDLDDLRQNESGVLSDVQSHLLEGFDEDSEYYKLIDDADNFDALLRNCESLHSKAQLNAELGAELDAWLPPVRTDTATQQQGAGGEEQRRVRRM